MKSSEAINKIYFQAEAITAQTAQKLYREIHAAIDITTSQFRIFTAQHITKQVNSKE